VVKRGNHKGPIWGGGGIIKDLSTKTSSIRRRKIRDYTFWVEEEKSMKKQADYKRSSLSSSFRKRDGQYIDEKSPGRGKGTVDLLGKRNTMVERTTRKGLS